MIKKPALSIGRQHYGSTFLEGLRGFRSLTSNELFGGIVQTHEWCRCQLLGRINSEENNLAPQVGLEPTTLRLTADWLLVASHWKHKSYARELPILPEIWGDSGGTAIARRLQFLVRGVVGRQPRSATCQTQVGRQSLDSADVFLTEAGLSNSWHGLVKERSRKGMNSAAHGSRKG